MKPVLPYHRDGINRKFELIGSSLVFIHAILYNKTWLDLQIQYLELSRNSFSFLVIY